MQTGGFVQTVTPDDEVKIDCAALAEESTAAAMFALTITDAAGEIPYGWMTATRLRSGVASLAVRMGPEDRTVETAPGVLGQFDMTISFWPEREWSGPAGHLFAIGTPGYGKVGWMTASGPEQQRYMGQGAVAGNAEGLGHPDPRTGTLLEETDAWTGIYFSEPTRGT